MLDLKKLIVAICNCQGKLSTCLVSCSLRSQGTYNSEIFPALTEHWVDKATIHQILIESFEGSGVPAKTHIIGKRYKQ